MLWQNASSHLAEEGLELTSPTPIQTNHPHTRKHSFVPHSRLSSARSCAFTYSPPSLSLSLLIPLTPPTHIHKNIRDFIVVCQEPDSRRHTDRQTTDERFVHFEVYTGGATKLLQISFVFAIFPTTHRTSSDLGTVLIRTAARDDQEPDRSSRVLLCSLIIQLNSSLCNFWTQSASSITTQTPKTMATYASAKIVAAILLVCNSLLFIVAAYLASVGLIQIIGHEGMGDLPAGPTTLPTVAVGDDHRPAKDRFPSVGSGGALFFFGCFSMLVAVLGCVSVQLKQSPLLNVYGYCGVLSWFLKFLFIFSTIKMHARRHTYDPVSSRFGFLLLLTAIAEFVLGLSACHLKKIYKRGDAAEPRLEPLPVKV